MAIQCKVDIPDVKGLDAAILTVGRDFYLNCTGEWPKNLAQEKLQFAGDENMKYDLKLLKFEFRNPQEADLTVTSYLAGEHKFPNVVLTDGDQKLDLGPVDFQVQSVLPQGEKVEPYGPIGPATIPVPLFYWLVLLAAVLIVALTAGLKIFRIQQRRKMLERLKEHDSPLAPLQQFHQSMRRLQRANPVFFGQPGTSEELKQGSDELFTMFKMYLSRRLQVPAFEWSENLVLKDIRKYHPQVFREFSRKLGALFTEFKKAASPQQNLKAEDLLQLSQTLRKTLEGIDRLLDQETSGGRR